MGQRYSRLTVVPCDVRLRVGDCVIQGASLIASLPPLSTYIHTYEYLHYRTSPDGVEVLTMPNGLYQLARRLCIVLNQSKLSDVLLINAVRCNFFSSLFLPLCLLKSREWWSHYFISISMVMSYDSSIVFLSIFPASVVWFSWLFPQPCSINYPSRGLLLICRDT